VEWIGDVIGYSCGDDAPELGVIVERGRKKI
jgi:hypothetical protein